MRTDAMTRPRTPGSMLVPALLLAAASACTSAPEPPPMPAELRVFSSNGVRSVIQDLQPEIERAVDRRLSIEFSTAATLKRKIDGGEAFDAAILTPVLIDDLVAQGKVAADSRTELARVGVGVGVREDAPPADIGTPEALKATLLGARSVAFGAEGQSRATIDRAFDRLGIADTMRQKSVLTGAGEAPVAVAAGEVDLVLTLMSEILAAPGVRPLGPFPAELQGYISFTAGRSSNTGDADGATALLRHLSGPAVAAAMKRHGLDPVGD